MARRPAPESTKANFHPQGSSWTVSHLDRFLQSEWGQRLFSAKETKSPLQTYSLCKTTVEGKIRPSPAFLAVPRDTPLLKDTSPPRRPASASTNRQYTPDITVLQTLSRGMTASSCRRQELAVEARTLMSAKARMQLAVAEKKQEKDFAAFKSQRAMITKQQRLLANQLQSAEVPNRPVSARPLNPQMGSSIGFGLYLPASPTRPQLKRFPDRDHNTFQTLFTPASQAQADPHREKLLQITRTTRPFNIVTGASNSYLNVSG